MTNILIKHIPTKGITKTVAFLFFIFSFMNFNAQNEITWNDVRVQNTKTFTTLTGKQKEIPALTQNQEELLGENVFLEGYVIGLSGGTKDSYALCNYESLDDSEKEDFILVNLVFDKSQDMSKISFQNKVKIMGTFSFNEYDLTGRNFTLTNSNIYSKQK